MGLELTDWFVILFSWLTLKQSFTILLGERLSLLLAVLGTFILFRIWQRLKDKTPDKFVPHLMNWLSEADSYSLLPDTVNAPLTVKPQLSTLKVN